MARTHFASLAGILLDLAQSDDLKPEDRMEAVRQLISLLDQRKTPLPKKGRSAKESLLGN